MEFLSTHLPAILTGITTLIGSWLVFKASNAREFAAGKRKFYDDLLNRVVALENKLESTTNENTILKNTNADLYSGKREAEGQNRILKMQLDELRDQNRLLREQNEQLRGQNELLQADLKSAMEQYSVLRERIKSNAEIQQVLKKLESDKA